VIVTEEVVDAQAVSSEAADEDSEADRSHVHAPDVDLFEQPLAGRKEVADRHVDHDARLGGFLILAKKGLLLIPRL